MKTKGFTLIELLVVIAIIGILSSVVLASLTTARSRGQAAAVQSELSNMRAQAELYYSTNNNSYGATTASCSAALFTSGTNNLSTLLSGINSKATGVNCGVATSTWAAAATAGGTHFCVDSTGVSVSTTTAAYVATDGACL